MAIHLKYTILVIVGNKNQLGVSERYIEDLMYSFSSVIFDPQK